MPSITVNSSEQKVLSTSPSSDNETKESKTTFRDIAEEIVAKERLKAWKKKKQPGRRSHTVALVGAIMEYLARRRQRRHHQPLHDDRDSVTAAESLSLLD